MIDFYFQNWAFAKEHRFSTKKSSTFLSLMKTVFDNDMSSNDLSDSIEKSFDKFRKLLLLHSVERPPQSTGIFTTDDVRAITDFITNGYYRHYRLYKYVFTKRVHVQIKQSSFNDVETVKIPRPLNSALPWTEVTVEEDIENEEA